MASTISRDKQAVRLRGGQRVRRPAVAGEPFPIAPRDRAKLPFPREMRQGTTVGLVVLLTLLGAAIRLDVTRGLSVDEILAADQAQRSLGGLIRGLAHGGVLPPLDPLLEWVMAHTLGSGDFSLRLPSLVAGAALVPAVAAVAAELLDRRTAVVAALFAALAPILAWYSQEVSPYALVALFGTLTVLGAVRARRRGRHEDWALFAVAATLTVWSSWSGVFVVVAGEVILAERALRRGEASASRRRFLASWGLASVALACQFVALGVLFADQLRTSGGLAGIATVGASGVSFYSAVSNVSWALFGFHPAAVTDAFSAVWPLGMLASLLMIGRRLSGRSWLLLLWALAPAAGTLILGLLEAGSFDVRYAVAGVPAVMVLLASIVTRGVPGRAGTIAAVAGVALVLFAALVDQQLDPNNPRRYDYRPALAQVERDAGPASRVFYEPTELAAVLERDAPRLRAEVLGPRLPNGAQARSVLLITSFTGRPAVRALLNRDLGALRATRHLVAHHSYPGVEVWWFAGWRFR
jgi:uncharacterized membrane protein